MRLIHIFVLLLFTLNMYANEKVVLQLKWYHQFQFAGYYAAKEKGFFDEVGLDVEIKERNLQFNNIQQVIDGEAQYGVADSVLFLYKAKQSPVVLVSPIFQHSPSILMSLKKDKSETVYDLNLKNVLFYPNDTDGFSLLALFKQLNINPNLIRHREKGDYQKLIDGKIDAMPAYLSNEPFLLKEQGVEFNIINPTHYGFDLYGDMLFTSYNEAINHPKRVEKFKEAVLKGWEYALDHQEEMVQLIHNKYNSSKSIEHLRFEAKVIAQMVSKESLPIGTLDKGRIEYILGLYKKYDILQQDSEITNFIFEDFQTGFSNLQLTAKEKNYIIEHPVLRVQNIPNFPPYNYIENGIAKGYIIEILQLMAEELGVKLEFVPMKSWAQSLEELSRGELDIIPQIVQNSEREVFLDFTEFSQTKYIPAIVVKSGTSLRTLDDLEGKKVAVVNKGFLHTLLKEQYPNIKLHLSNNFKENFELLSSGKVDASIDEFSLTHFFINEDWLTNIEVYKLSELQPSSLKMGVQEGNALLKSILEKVNAKLSYETISQLRTKWMNMHQSQVVLNQNQIEYLLEKASLTVCVQSNYMPFEGVEQSEYQGMLSEYVKMFEKELPVSITRKVVANADEALQNLRTKQCDFVPFSEIDDDVESEFNHSLIYNDQPLVIAALQSSPFIKKMAQLNDKKVGIFLDKHHFELLKKEYPKIKFSRVKSIDEGLEKIMKGQLYAMIDLLAPLGYHIQKSQFNQIKIAGKLDEVKKLSMASLKSEPLLNSVINSLLQAIPEEKHQKIESNWSFVKYQEEVDYSTVILVVIFFIFIILLVLYKNQSIRKINQKMEEYIKIVDENVLTSSTDLRGNIIYVSQAFCKVSGYEKEDLLGKNHNIIRHPDMPKELFVDLWKTITSNQTWQGEIKNKKSDGGFYWVHATITPTFDYEGKKVGYTAIRHDISNKKIIEEISITDGLTSIFNRRHFNDLFPKYINSAKRQDELLCFLIMDVDHFKQYNDTYGHQKGDEVLKSISNVLKKALKRADDYCFRLGGEEFGVLFKAENKKNALLYANEIRERIEAEHIEHTGNSASKYVTASMGLFCDRVQDVEDEDEIFKLADDLLYKAKASGRNKVETNA